MTLDALAARLDRIERATRLQAAVTLTVEDAATVLGCGPKAVRGLVHSGRVRAIRLGTRKLLIPRADLVAWVEREAV